MTAPPSETVAIRRGITFEGAVSALFFSSPPSLCLPSHKATRAEIVAKDGALTPLEWNGMIATPKSGKPGFERLKLEFGLYAKYASLV